MRHVVPCLALLAVLLPAVPARAGDDDDHVQRLERRVEMLIDLVAELRAEVLALRKRVDELEAERAAAPRVVVENDGVEVIPATPIEPAPVVALPDVSGLYTLDKEATVDVILAAQLEGVEDEELASMIRQGVEAEFQDVDITLRMEGDGTFFVRVEATAEAEKDGTTARGTWTRDPSVLGAAQRLLLLTTHEGGEEDPSPTELVGRWEQGRLTLREGEEDASGYVMVFRRKTPPPSRD